MLKARYLMRDSLIEESLKLFHQSRKDNPFIGVPEFELGRISFFKKINGFGTLLFKNCL